MIHTHHHNMAGSDKDDHVSRPWQQQQQHHPSSAASRIYRVSRASGGKDRHSKVLTAKGLRDRRVRLSVPTALQFYDLQDRLGLDQPSKAVDWLIKAAADAISQLPALDASSFPRPEAEPSSASGSSKGSALYLSQPKEDKSGSSFTELLSGGGGSGSAASTADFFREAALFGQMQKAHHLESGSGENPHKRFSFLQEHLNPAAAAAERESGGLNFSISSSGLIQGLERGPLQSNLPSHIHHDHVRHRSGDDHPAASSNGLIGLNLPFFAAPAAAGAFAGGQLYYTNGYWQHSNSKGEGKG